MGKLKIKKGVKKLGFILIVSLLFLFIAIYSGINIYKQKQYEKTYEYKLLQLGYDNEDVKIILDKYKNKEIDYILTTEVNNNYIDLLSDKYFIYNNFYDYLDYQKENSTLSIRNIIEIINTKRNNEYYENTTETDISKKELMLVNKYHYLDESYTPENLVTISQNYSWGEKGSQKATEETYEAFLDMWEDANNEGYYLMVSSSYRTYQKQDLVYKDYEDARGTEYADTIAARPGYSEHQTGYTLDIFEKNNSSQKTFHETEVYTWLKSNAHKYGFILRYPEDKEDITGYSFESWHYRYVGIEEATYIYNNNISFDEYYAYFIK